MSGGPESPRAVATWTRWGAPILVAVVTLAAFLPALEGEFVNWDDQRNFLDNQHYRGLGPRQLAWMFTSAHMGHYIPVTWITLGLDYVLWGMNPFGYHLTSLVLHAATALALYFLGMRLLRLAAPSGGWNVRAGAAAAALLFAVHPLRAESVAWVTERRDVTSGLFYVCALIAYVKAVGSGPGLRRGWYRGALALFLGALLSKSITATLPVVLLVLDVYPLRRLGGAAGWRVRDVWMEKAPFALLGLAVSAMAFVGVLFDARLSTIDDMNIVARVLLSVYGVAFYLFTSVVPLGLSPLYQFPVTITWLHVAATLGGSVLAVALRRSAPAFTAAWIVYVATLSPVLGIFHNGPQIVADRYSYLASLGWVLLIGAQVARPWKGAPAVRGVVAGWILLLGTLTWQQTRIWESSTALWSHAVAVNPENRTAHFNLARAHAADGRLAAAVAHYEETRRRSLSTAFYDAAIGDVFERAGLPAAARDRYVAALRERPTLAEACHGLRRLATRLDPAPAIPASCPP